MLHGHVRHTTMALPIGIDPDETLSGIPLGGLHHLHRIYTIRDARAQTPTVQPEPTDIVHRQRWDRTATR